MAEAEKEKDNANGASIILFYKYHPLSSSLELMEPYRQAMETFCISLKLKGRILLGCSDKEGINGTLAGSPENVRAFTYALLGPDYVSEHVKEPLKTETHEKLQEFWTASNDFAQAAGVPVLTMESPDDFKWSTADASTTTLFPDLVVKLVQEIISTGGVLADISLEETSQGYLTPQQWHDEMLHLDTSKTVVIDCRNQKECAIGHFENAVNPHTTTFSQFPQWSRENAHLLKDKRVLMYCTGGIRCEKASAYVRRQGVAVVQHLKGGIHKYLEQYGEDGLWKGKNFVFDGRGAATGHETQTGGASNVANSVVVGQCVYCHGPYDIFHANCVCTVCREPTLVCKECQKSHVEFHCTDHFGLRTCYFTNLDRFSNEQLLKQLEELQEHLQEIAVGKRYKPRRKTLYKQCDKIQALLATKNRNATVTTACRNCGDSSCNGSCWGFHGLKRKELLEQRRGENVTSTNNEKKPRTESRPSSNHRISKHEQRQRSIEEIQKLKLSLPPSEHCSLGIRVPPPCTRVLQSRVKGKWCGRPAIQVLQQEFGELAKDRVFQPALEKGLLRLNGERLSNETVGTRLKNMDTISRIVHWHEPPVQTPCVISVQKEELPQTVVENYGIEGSDTMVYVCDKPSSVPVHPAGPYLSNSLTLMVEAQERLVTRSLIPCHRIDRVTSGLTLCCTNIKVARLIQSKIDEGLARKLYLARVKGQFPASEEQARERLPECTNFALWSWHGDVRCLKLNAPVETVDPGNGIRTVAARGKPSRSRFQFLAYDTATDSSLISCAPLTGRGHQLRVHLQWLGYSIDGDLSYGGRSGDDSCKDAAVQRMKDVIQDASSDLALDSISSEDVAAARSACPCCQNGADGITSSFTEAQLLVGSAIRLHALRYEIPIPQRKSKDTLVEPLAVLKMEVALPEWAQELESHCIPWLKK